MEKKTNRILELIKNTFVLGIGNIISSFSGVVLLPVLTRSLTNEEYGIYDLATTIITIATPVLTLRLDSGIFRFVIDVRDDETKIKEILSTVLSTTFLFGLVMSICLFFIPIPYIQDHKSIILLYIFFHGMLNVLCFFARGLGDNKLYTIVSCMQSILMCFLSFLFVSKCNLHISGVFLAMIMTVIITLPYAFLSLRIYRLYSIYCFSVKTIKTILAYSIPMIPTAISLWIINASDRIIISSVLGVGTNGIYAVANKFPSYLASISSILQLSWFENASVYAKDDDASQYFKNATHYISIVTLSISMLLLSFSPILFRLLIDQKYYEAYFQVPVLIFAYFLSGISGHVGGILIALKRSKTIGITSATGAIINVVVNLLLIRIIGLYAASISTAVSYFIVLLIRIMIMYKELHINILSKKIIAGVLLYIILCILFYSDNTVTNIASVIISSVFVMLANYSVLINFFSIIKRKVIF